MLEVEDNSFHQIVLFTTILLNAGGRLVEQKEVIEETNPESFESAMEQLETLVSRMESGDLSLEESLKAFEQGVHLTRFCQDQLQKAELKVQELSSKGEFIEVDQKMNLDSDLKLLRRSIDAKLASILPKESPIAEPMLEAMRYAVLGGGKRIRPLLTCTVCSALDGRFENALHLDVR